MDQMAAKPTQDPLKKHLERYIPPTKADHDRAAQLKFQLRQPNIERLENYMLSFQDDRFGHDDSKGWQDRIERGGTAYERESVSIDGILTQMAARERVLGEPCFFNAELLVETVKAEIDKLMQTSKESREWKGASNGL